MKYRYLVVSVNGTHLLEENFGFLPAAKGEFNRCVDDGHDTVIIMDNGNLIAIYSKENGIMKFPLDNKEHK